MTEQYKLLSKSRAAKLYVTYNLQHFGDRRSRQGRDWQKPKHKTDWTQKTTKNLNMDEQPH